MVNSTAGFRLIIFPSLNLRHLRFKSFKWLWVGKRELELTGLSMSGSLVLINSKYDHIFNIIDYALASDFFSRIGAE